MRRKAVNALGLCLLLLAVGPRAGLAAGAGGAAEAAPAPRPLSEAERQAVGLALDYLAGGPAAWWNALSADSPLRRLGRDAALAEIETRAGSPSAATWTLETTTAALSAHGAVFALEFPSGVDDTLVVDLVQEGGGWKIHSLTISAEAVPEGAAGRRRRVSPNGAGEEPPPDTGWLPPAPASTTGAGALAALLAAAPLLGAVVYRRRRRWLRPLAVGGAVALAVAAVGGIVLLAPRLLRSGGAPAPAAVETPQDGAELRVLLPMRRALTSAAPEATLPEVPAPARGPAGSGGAAEVAELWRAQHLLGGMDLNGAEAILAALPTPGRAPLVEVLRARLAFLRLREVDTGLAYERARELGVVHDGLLWEAAQAFAILGFEDRAREVIRRLGELGSRQAETYYSMAELAVYDDRPWQGEPLLLAGWQLEPLERAELLHRPLLASLLSSSEVRQRVDLGAADEPVVPCSAAGRQAVAVPRGFEARLLGRKVRFTNGSATLLVPGGCELAPADAPADSAASWREADEAAALDRLPELLRTAHTAGALAQPSLRRKTGETAEALARRNRWGELVELTDSLAQQVSGLPPALVQLRAAALVRLDRSTEARALLVSLAKDNRVENRADPATLYQLADLVARDGGYDLALRLVAKANSELPYTPDEARLRQLQMEKRLSISFLTLDQGGFQLVYPPERDEDFAAQVGRILTAERHRLERWIPVKSGAKRVEVHLLPFSDFRLGYSPGLEILGLYDGKIRVPLGNVRRFNPFVVSILTHELAHAMIAEATGDRAPRWFHEGLAQHVEMRAGRANPIPNYREAATLLAFPLLDDALQSYSPDLISIAYDEAAWTLHYVDTRYGAAGIRRLLDAFRAGKTTEEAIQAAFGVPMRQFDKDLWAWCIDKAPSSWKVDVVDYDRGDRAF